MNSLLKGLSIQMLIENLNTNTISSAKELSSSRLDQFVLNLASLLRVDTIFITRVDNATHEFQVISNLYEGMLNKVGNYDFRTTPCINAFKNGTAEYNGGLLSLFSGDPFIRTLYTDSYVGVRISDRAGKPVGVLSVFFKRALSKHKFELNLIRLVADFLSSEINNLTRSQQINEIDTTACHHDLDVYSQWLEDNIAQGRLTSWSYELEQDKLVCSETFATVLGISSLDKIAKLSDFLALINSQDKRSVSDDFAQALAATSSQPIRSVFNLITGNHHSKRIQNDIYPVVNESGIVTRLDCISKDITASELSKKRAAAQERVLETILATTPIGLIKLDANREISWVNKQACKMFGYTVDDFHTLKEQGPFTAADLNIYFDEDLPKFEKAYKSIYENKLNTVGFETRYRHRNGSVLWTKVDITCVRNEQHEVQYFINSIQNITEQIDNKQRLNVIESIYKHSSEGIMLCDANEVIIDVNPAFEIITGYSAEDAIGRTHRLLNSGAHDDQFYSEIKQALIAKGEWKGVIWSRNRASDIFAQQVTISSILENDQLKYIFAVFTDVTESKKTEHKIITQSNYDTLTGLPNRQYFGSETRQFIDKAQLNNKKLAILYIDIDDFKSVNNAENFQTGDRLLKDITQRLSTRCRSQDFLARIDGDEFAFIIPDIVNKRQAEVYAKQLQGAFAQAYQLGNQQRYVTASLGITMYPSDGDSTEALMQSAEQAVFEAKRLGRGKCVTYTRKLSEAAHLKTQTLVELAEAIKKKQLKVFYQPIIDNRSGKTDKLEALVRWEHETRGFISPAEFIPLAEEGGLIQSLGEFVLDQACKDLKILHERGFSELEMSVNRSILEFRTVDMQATEWLKVIEAHQLPFSSITMEITESLLMDMDGQYMQRIHALKSAGIKIAIDDFGTGYSSLNYLRSLPADLVKIDRSFIINIPDNEQDSLLLEGIIQIVHNLGMKVVTEGIETEEQLSVLKDKLCDYSQGFLLCRPIALHSLIEYLDKQ